jgi:23S rRNA pseudouridine955/2504/2580 synthase
VVETIIGGKAGPQVQRLVVDEGSEGQRLDNFLIRVLKGVPKTHVYRVIRSGEVRINKGRAAADTRLVLGDEVRVPPVRMAEAKAEGVVPPREFAVLFEDEHLLAIDKPAGVAVHGGSGVAFGVIEQLRRARPTAKFLELVHRLDKETSGVLLLAKKRSALTHVQDQFRERGTVKIYSALVLGLWPRSLKVIDVHLHKRLTSAGQREVRAVTPEHDNAKRAISLVTVLEWGADCTLLDVNIKTGRTHQIRVHLAHCGHPIAGDPKYGDFARNRSFAKATGVARLLLHARELQFEHPATRQRVCLRSDAPGEFKAAIGLAAN